MTKSKHFSFAGLVVELAIVIGGVLLALAANEWRESAANDQLRQEALKNLRMEIRRNSEEISTGIAEHRKMADTLANELAEVKAALKAGKEYHSRLNFSFELSVLENTAWRTAEVTQAVRFFDYQLVSNLAAIYGLQEIYANHGNNIFAEMGSADFHNSPYEGFLKSSLFNLRLTINIEENLLDAYRKVDHGDHDAD